MLSEVRANSTMAYTVSVYIYYHAIDLEYDTDSTENVLDYTDAFITCSTTCFLMLTLNAFPEVVINNSGHVA